jgi:hypothetical protein
LDGTPGNAAIKSPTIIASSPHNNAVAVLARTARCQSGVRAPEYRTANGSVATARETFSAIV